MNMYISLGIYLEIGLLDCVKFTVIAFTVSVNFRKFSPRTAAAPLSHLDTSLKFKLRVCYLFQVVLGLPLLSSGNSQPHSLHLKI